VSVPTLLAVVATLGTASKAVMKAFISGEQFGAVGGALLFDTKSIQIIIKLFILNKCNFYVLKSSQIGRKMDPFCPKNEIGPLRA
jgi:hypothetical protein